MWGLGAVVVAPEIVAPLLQLEGVVGLAVRAPGVQVAIPEDLDAYSTALHTAHQRSTVTWARTLSLTPPRTMPPTDPPAMPSPQRRLQLQPRGPQCGTPGSRGWRRDHIGSAGNRCCPRSASHWTFEGWREGRSGQDGDKEGLGLSGPTHTYLEKLNLLKVTVFLMNSVKFSAWTSRGFLWMWGR